MGIYANQISDLRLFKELRSSCGRDSLSESDLLQLTGMVARVADTVGPLLKRIPDTFAQYTDHDIAHCRNVIDLMGRFIPPHTLALLNGVELALLLLSALLHDVGMVVSDGERDEALHSDAFATFRALRPDSQRAIDAARAAGTDRQAVAIEDALLADYFRLLHPERARAYVESALAGRPMLGDVDLSDDISTLCESHDWGVHESRDSRHPERSVSRLPTKRRVYGLSVNLQYLACCLRLADIMDFDRSRTPIAVFQHLDFTSDRAWREWNKHLQIRGWGIEEREVAYEAECTHPVFYVAVHEFLDALDAELRECRYLVEEAPRKAAERYLLHLPHVVDRRQVCMKDKRFLAGGFRFQLEYDEIMRLLMDRSLYPDPSLFLRELLQNSLDACRHKEALWKEQGRPGRYQPRIEVWDYSDDPNDPRIIFQDNGMGMSPEVIQNYFMRIGKSYYRSPAFNADRERLARKGIALEACSCFGIGILSCFLVSDGFVVETCREGHEPLRVTIEGPSRYFLIERLSGFRPWRSAQGPAADALDISTGASGTRVIVPLKAPAELDVHGVLDGLAPNADYDIAVYRGSRRKPRLIRRRRWRRTICLSAFPEALDSLSLPFRRTMTKAELEDVARNLEAVLVPSVIPMHQWEFSAHLDGTAWLWLLRDEHGEPCPERGFLRIVPDWYSSGIALCGIAGFAASLGKLAYDPDGDKPRPLEWHEIQDALRCALGSGEPPFSRIRRKCADDDFPLPSGAQMDCEGLEEILAGFDEWWAALAASDRSAIYRVFRRTNPDTSPHWCSTPGCPQLLLEGSREWTKLGVSLWGRHSGGADCQLYRRPMRLALHGIALPAGVTDWDARNGKARRLNLVLPCGGMLADARGAAAPTPAASRLFADPFEGAKIAVPYARAALRHAASLVLPHPEDESRRRWLGKMLDAMESSRKAYWMLALRYEAPHLDRMLRYAVVSQGERVFMSRAEIAERFGQEAPIARSRGSTDGIDSWDPLSSVLLGYRRRSDRHREAPEVVDMSGDIPELEGSLDCYVGRYLDLFPISGEPGFMFERDTE